MSSDSSSNVNEITPTPKNPRKPALKRPYPRVTVEQALRVPTALKEKNAGNPWKTEEVAKALGLSKSSDTFYYLVAGSRDYGFTIGTRHTSHISLEPLGEQVVYPKSAEEQLEALRRSFFNIDLFKKVFEYYKGCNLPEMEFLANTLQKEFALDSSFHNEFVRVFSESCQYLGLSGIADAILDGSFGTTTVRSAGDGHSAPSVVTLAKPEKTTGLLCFVIMPFVERNESHPSGFFNEVLKSLIVPAAKKAGFTVRSAKRQGSDVIQKTIVNDLLEADLVLADLTEHNPNVMFELGMRMAEDKPVALIRAKGTGSIFDVDNMLRVYDYDPRLWPSTLEHDLPNIESHLLATWENRESDHSYMKLLGRRPVMHAASQ